MELSVQNGQQDSAPFLSSHPIPFINITLLSKLTEAAIILTRIWAITEFGVRFPAGVRNVIFPKPSDHTR
jgi:hypothetical protein